MWLSGLFKQKSASAKSAHPLSLFNTLGKEKQLFELAPNTSQVRMYNCGPTVYGQQHIGNLSMFVFTDILRRVLERNGMSVKQVINFTDFGHLISDGDEGEDKMTKGMKAEHIPLTMENMKAYGERYAQAFLEDIRTLGIDTDKITFPRASDFVPTMIAMIKTLEEKGYAYVIKDGVYFDVARFPGYGALGVVDTSKLREGVRVAANPDKRSAADFALWKKSAKGGPASGGKLGWDSPWGKGFPGWHLECSAMINSVLGKQIDIHTGGIEHIAVHHNNEIAQSEASTGKKPLSRFWLHREHILMGTEKIAKSKGNAVYLSEVIERGIPALALRYWFLTSHYRTPSSFSWSALEGAAKAYERLLERYAALSSEPEVAPPPAFEEAFTARLNDDIDTPSALALVWESLKDETYSLAEQKAILDSANAVFGLGLEFAVPAAQQVGRADLPEAVLALLEEREAARATKDFAKADELRDKISQAGYSIEDSVEGAKLRKN
ncbi:cysteine--tRNA ligase [Candidatus Kaiserbacteria bacterium]|nr:cysteine--tRNA ligase [Candidatus Kaiserbacteria bacterium]